MHNIYTGKFITGELFELFNLLYTWVSSLSRKSLLSVLILTFSVMMVAVVRNFLLLLVIFLTTGQKGLLNAEICSKSAETICPVKKCPANETEWNKAAKRKNCSKIQKNDNCTEVEYHCLVNEIRKNFIEVCTKSRIIQKGYCLMYSKNKAKTDWLNYCANQTSCNCSRDGYLSTMAYKWQCCYNGANILPNKNRRGDSVKDQSNNEHVEIWLPVLLLFIVVAAVYAGCVYYGKKRDQNKTFFEALKIWKNFPSASSGMRMEKNEENDQVTNLLTGTAEEDRSQEIQVPQAQGGGSSNQGMSTSTTQVASASPNAKSSNQCITAPNTPESSDPKTPVLKTLLEDVAKLSPNENRSNQGITANTQEENLHRNSGTPGINTSLEDVLRSLTSESPNRGSLYIGMSGLDNQEPSVPESQTTRGDISQSEIPEAALCERVDKMQKSMKDLKILIDFMFGKGIWDVDYKLKLANLKITTMGTMFSEPTKCADIAALERKATGIENKLYRLLQEQQEKRNQLVKRGDKLLLPLHNNQVEDEHEPEGEASKSSAASNAMETVENRFDDDWQFPDDKKYENDEEELDYEDKPIMKKLNHLIVQTGNLLRDVEQLKKNVNKTLSPGLIDTTEESLNEVKANIDFLSESYCLGNPHSRHRFNVSSVNKLYELYIDVRKKYNELKLRLDKD